MYHQPDAARGWIYVEYAITHHSFRTAFQDFGWITIRRLMGSQHAHTEVD